MIMRRAEWQLPDGTHPKDSPVTCPDCGKLVPLNSSGLEELPLIWGEPPMAPLYLT